MIEGIGKAYRPAVQDRLAYEGTEKTRGGTGPCGRRRLTRARPRFRGMRAHEACATNRERPLT